MGEQRRSTRFRGRLERHAALPLPSMGLGLLLAAGFCMLLLASVDGLWWKYSEERETLRAQLAVKEAENAALADELLSLRREHAALGARARELHRAHFAPTPIGLGDERGGRSSCSR